MERKRYLPYLIAVAALLLTHTLAAAQPEPTALTSDQGVEDYASFSADGKLVAYAASAVGDVFGGNWDIWLIELETGTRRNVTAAYTGDDRFPSFSPSGDELAFWSDRDGGGYVRMKTTGGPTTRMESSTTFASGPGVWSADSSELAVIVRDEAGLFLEILPTSSSSSSSASGARRWPLAGKSTRRFDLSGSPDGRYYAYVDGSSLTANVTQIFVLDTATGEAVPVTDGWTNDWSPSWSPDGKNLYIVSNRGGKRDVWRQPVADGRPQGEPVPITRDVGIRHASVASDGKRLVLSRGQTVAHVWRVPRLRERAARWSDAERITHDEAYVEFISLSPDGKQLATTSDASGNPDLWIVDVETREQRQLTDDTTPDWGPAWSPDASSVAFYGYRSGNRDLWVMPASGGPARQLTDHPAADMYPTWSPDGKHIAFYSVRTGNRDLWVLPVSGGEPRQLTYFEGDDLFPHWSPTGECIAFYSERDGEGRIWGITPDGQQSKPVSSGPGRFPRFSRDGTHVIFTGWGERMGNIYEVELSSGRETALTELSGRAGNLGSYVLATDDAFVYFTWEQNLGDLFIHELP